MIYDTQEIFKNKGGRFPEQIPFYDLVYADDMLLINVLGGDLQKYMDIVIQLGASYGLQINWKKVEVMMINSSESLFDSSGKQLKSKSSLGYLGATIHDDGKIDSELSRRLGMASNNFKLLRSI